VKSEYWATQQRSRTYNYIYFYTLFQRTKSY